ncbi:hypothetical protein M8818_001482 [Zalaria obscura]|uniref:Uncharacterized protein n=1 Tax=Zalaria obscura TaxID=2024903 RepID=A0ACC3SL00_9PEZI
MHASKDKAANEMMATQEVRLIEDAMNHRIKHEMAVASLWPTSLKRSDPSILSLLCNDSYNIPIDSYNTPIGSYPYSFSNDTSILLNTTTISLLIN